MFETFKPLVWSWVDHNGPGLIEIRVDQRLPQMHVGGHRQDADAIFTRVRPVQVLVNPVKSKAIWCRNIMMHNDTHVLLRIICQLNPETHKRTCNLLTTLKDIGQRLTSNSVSYECMHTSNLFTYSHIFRKVLCNELLIMNVT